MDSQIRCAAIAVLAVTLIGSAAGAQSPGVPTAQAPGGEALAAREAAARRYLAVMTPTAMMEEVSLTTFRGLPPVEAHELAKQFVEELRMDVLERTMIEAIARNFTIAEIDALTEFYASPHGRSAMSKMSAYMADLTPAMQSEMHRALAIVRKRGEDQPLAAPAPR